MIDPYIIDSEIYERTNQSGPARLIADLTESDDFAGAAIINVDAWLNQKNNYVIEPDSDTPVLYGKDPFPLEEDASYLYDAQKENRIQTYVFTKNSNHYKKFYVPISKGKVMVIISDLSGPTIVIDKLIFIFISSFLLALLLIFIVFRFITKKHLKPLELINNHINQVATGDLTNRLSIQTNNEWGRISAHLNSMTDEINKLVMEVKEKIDSIRLVSAILPKTVDSVFQPLQEISGTMTFDSRDSFNEIELQIAALKKKWEHLKHQAEQGSNTPELVGQLQILGETIDQMNELNYQMKTNISKLTEMNLTTFDVVEEFRHSTVELYALSKQLEENINKFKVLE